MVKCTRIECEHNLFDENDIRYNKEELKTCTCDEVVNIIPSSEDCPEYVE